ncbi:hypothetical protein [Apilactobacillus timberlakei]|nr:hypothetical protein [Apilactobacillus timberlakei]
MEKDNNVSYKYIIKNDQKMSSNSNESNIIIDNLKRDNSKKH